MSLLSLLYAYLLGGVTFIPLLVIAFVYLHPKTEAKRPEKEPLRAGEIEESLLTGLSSFKHGWITVTHEYLSSPDEIPSNTQSVSDSQEGKSAYASLYKLVKNKTIKNGASASGDVADSAESAASGPASTPVASPAKTTANGKKHRYYAVLKHGNLFLYKNEKTNDVKHVIVLFNQVVTLWPRNLSEGSLFTKYSSIAIIRKDWLRTRRLSDNVRHGSGDTDWEEEKKITIDDVLNPKSNLPAPPGTFFIYTDINHDKEDWYYALIRATKSSEKPKTDKPKADKPLTDKPLTDKPLTDGVAPEAEFDHQLDKSTAGQADSLIDPNIYAKTLHFETQDMISLIQTLYSSEGQLQTKWFNALVGRLFLSLQNTDVMRNYLVSRIEKKLNKIKTPGFLDKFQITRVRPGKSAPFITFPVLKEISPEGDLLISWYFHYFGEMSVQLATKVNINLGSRFKTREVDVVLSMTLEKLQGPMLVRVKAPPSARLWYSFEHEPTMSVKVEPIISSRQMSYNIITNTIEKRLKEAVKETLVLPHWDDIIFYDTSTELYRGGVWDKDVRRSDSPATDSPEVKDAETQSMPEPLRDDVSFISSVSEPKSDSLVDSVPKQRNKLGSNIIDFSKRLRKGKSAHTLGIDETNCLADGSVVGSPTRSEMTIDVQPEARVDPIRKLGNDKGENEKTASTYHPPEMISSRRPRKKSSSTIKSDTEKTGESLGYDFGSFYKETQKPPIIPPSLPPRDFDIAPKTPPFPSSLPSDEVDGDVALSDAKPALDLPIKRSSTTRKPPPDALGETEPAASPVN